MFPQHVPSQKERGDLSDSLCAGKSLLTPGSPFRTVCPTMSGKIFLLLGVILAAACVAKGAELPPHPSGDGSGVLLLRNGNILQGHIEHNGDYYTVTSPGEETQVRVASVEFLCHDLRDGYRQKKAAIQANDIEQHVQLCLWCERHGLLDCAGEELTAAEALDRQHPMISVLRRRLKVETQQKTEPRRLPQNTPAVPSDPQLDQMTRDMPAGTVESFVQVVEPILLNHCPGAIGYVLPGQKRLQLMRPPLGEKPSRRITQRNLYAVLQCIDWNNPGESPLLKASVGMAAAGAVGSFPVRHSMQYEKLAQWVYQVAQRPMPIEEPANSIENVSFADLAGGSPTAGSAGIPRTPRIPYLPSSKRGNGKSAIESAESNNSERDSPAKPAGSSPSGSGRGSLRNAAAKAIAPALDAIDPYDPAAFNNQANAPTTLPTPAARVLHGNEPAK